MTDDTLTFDSSAEAERFLQRTPALRRASAFSWWKGRGNLWGIAIDRGKGPVFIAKANGKFTAGGTTLERKSAVAMQDLTEKVNALIGPPALQEKKNKQGHNAQKGPHRELLRPTHHGGPKRAKGKLRKNFEAVKRLDYSKTKHPNFTGKRRPKSS